MGDRPSGDVDLFTDWQRRADFGAVLDLVVTALTDSGYAVSIEARADTFARQLLRRPTIPAPSLRRWNWPPTGGRIRRSSLTLGPCCIPTMRSATDGSTVRSCAR